MMKIKDIQPWRTLAEVLQAIIIIGLPFLRLNGESALRFDIPSLKLHFFGTSVWMEEFFIVLVAIIFFTFLTALITLLFGRIWCGWLCPQTVLLDFTRFVEKAHSKGVGHKLTPSPQPSPHRGEGEVVDIQTFSSPPSSGERVRVRGQKGNSYAVKLRIGSVDSLLPDRVVPTQLGSTGSHDPEQGNPYTIKYPPSPLPLLLQGRGGSGSNSNNSPAPASGERVRARPVLDTGVRGQKGNSLTIEISLYMATFGISIIVAASLIWYFVSPYEFLGRLISLNMGKVIWGFWTALTAVLFLNFVFLRHRFCATVCPYAKLQSVVGDDRTLVIAFDTARQGECLNCLACVRACPVGLDIRNGLNASCINCAECVDACAEIRLKSMSHNSHSGLDKPAPAGRKPGESRGISKWPKDWIPAFAGMTNKNINPVIGQTIKGQKKRLIGYFFGAPGDEGRILRPNVLMPGLITMASFVFLVYLASIHTPLNMTVLPNYNFSPRITGEGMVINSYILAIANSGASDLELDIKCGELKIVPERVVLERGEHKKIPVYVVMNGTKAIHSDIYHSKGHKGRHSRESVNPEKHPVPPAYDLPGQEAGRARNDKLHKTDAISYKRPPMSIDITIEAENLPRVKVTKRANFIIPETS